MEEGVVIGIGVGVSVQDTSSTRGTLVVTDAGEPITLDDGTIIIAG